MGSQNKGWIMFENYSARLTTTWINAIEKNIYTVELLTLTYLHGMNRRLACPEVWHFGFLLAKDIHTHNVIELLLLCSNKRLPHIESLCDWW